jgi:putative (di)nucleoside polyphosphate hydrolase
MAVTFRSGVGMIILDEQGRALALERADRPKAWQLPQGGIEDDESPMEALWRELREETGLTQTHVSAFAEVPEWLGYELPPEARSAKTGRGQVHKWFILRALTAELPVNLPQDGDREFQSWRWVDLEKLAEQVVAFRQPVYRRLAQVVQALA